jgi:hypothetical protein
MREGNDGQFRSAREARRQVYKPRPKQKRRKTHSDQWRCCTAGRSLSARALPPSPAFDLGKTNLTLDDAVSGVPQGGNAMKGLLLGLGVTLAVGLLTTLVSVPAEAQRGRNVAEFCNVWQRICNRTCPTGPGNCRSECASRNSACRTSGCFHFNRPRPRCFNNPADRR